MIEKASQYFQSRFKKNEAEINELTYLFWECTQHCNLNCIHCGTDCNSDSSIKDMPFEDFLKAIEPLKTRYKRDSITIIITGGEPLIRKDLAQCGKALRKNGFRWGIVTNGYLYDEDMHARLLSAGLGAITLSIDGYEKTHNWLRGDPNSYNRAMKALDLITSSERLNYDVVTCVHPGNIEELHYLSDLLISKNVKAWRLFTIAPIGRASQNDNLQLNPSQFKRLMNFIAEIRTDKTIDVKFSCESFVGVFEKLVRDSFFFCRAGINIASILVDGSISACPNINRHFTQGNIYKDNLLDVWENKFGVMRNRNWTKTGDCKNCSDFKRCNGGAMHLWDEKQDCILTCANQKIKLIDLK